MQSPSKSKAPQPTFELTAKQAELVAAASSDARHILAYGGSRSGKTFAFCYCLAARALMAPGSRHLIARLHNIDVRQSVMVDTWPKVMKLAFPGVPYDTNKTDQFIVMPGGAEVWFGGLDDKERVEKILGKEFASIYVNEASQVAYETITTMRTRLAQVAMKRDGRSLNLKAYYDLNPTGRGHWTYREFVEGVRPENGMPIEKGSRAHVVLNPTDNPYLPAAYHAELDGLPDKQRQRFRDGKYLSEVPGALWSLDDRTAGDGAIMPGIDTLRRPILPPVKRVVIGVDPSGTDGVGGDSIGIVVAAQGVDGHGYVVADLTCKLGPAGWARVVANAVEKYGADRVVAEKNFGGAMVEANLRSESARMPIRMVTASRGKVIRAEPIAAQYEQGKIHHVGTFAELEEQMTMTTTGGYAGAGSPDRLDALVWALTNLSVSRPKYDMRALIGDDDEWQ